MAFQGLGSWPQSILILCSMRLLMFTVVENTAHKLQSCAKFMACGSKTRAWNLKRRNKTHLKPQSPQKQHLCATILLQLLSKISLFSHHKCGTAASQRGCINKFRQALTFNSTMYSLSTVVWKHLYNPLLKYLKYLSEQEKNNILFITSGIFRKGTLSSSKTWRQCQHGANTQYAVKTYTN